MQFSGGYATLNSSANSGVVFAPGLTGKQIQDAESDPRRKSWVQTFPSLLAANGGVSTSYFTPNVTAGQLATCSRFMAVASIVRGLNPFCVHRSYKCDTD